ncbi:MAG TPA: uroporphyrinogen decarboxylase family protein [Spirochaetia bacterium]|nr:uroporphyrinogen decarboxylase family protein [Spirochaetia bacterium]
MSNRDDFFKLTDGSGELGKIPCVHFGFWDEKSMHKLAPPDCYDENTLPTPSDDPTRDSFSREPRTAESRDRAVRMAEYLDTTFIGVGKGGVLSFGHGGPAEIQPAVVEKNEEYKVLLYEGGHKRKIHYNPHSVHYYDFPVREEKDLDRLELPDMGDPARFQDIEEDCRRFKEAGFVPTGSIQGFFSGIHNSFMNFEDTLVNLILEPGFMKRFTRVLAEMSLKAVGMYLDRGVEVIDVCDDLGNAGGMIISPQLFREFFLPWYEELVRFAHERGGYVHLHSHGNIAPVLADLASIGVDIINPFDWEENPDLPELVRRFRGEFIFCGGSVGDLYQHSLEEVEFIVRRACRLARIAQRGYMYMGNAGIVHLSVEDWEEWRKISLRIRTEEAKRN